MFSITSLGFDPLCWGEVVIVMCRKLAWSLLVIVLDIETMNIEEGEEVNLFT